MSRRFALISAALFAGTIFPATPAEATVTVNIMEVGPDVVATANGTLNLALMAFRGTFSADDRIFPAAGVLDWADSGRLDVYLGISGPTRFGPGGPTLASTSLGSFLLDIPDVGVPEDYVSGSPISATATYSGQTFASLGVTPGQYIYYTPSDTVIINIGQAAGAVPEPSTWVMMLLGFAGIGFGMRSGSARKHCRKA